jgi:peptidoglycan/LPS O-acetylase OafA/YrhL
MGAGATKTGRRLFFLDCVRGLAALFVVFEHVGDSLYPQCRWFTHNVFSFGKFGVAAFFLTSGFVIPLSLERGGTLKRFWISRFFRLYPLYWFSIAVVLSQHFLGPSFPATPFFSEHLTRNAVVNLTMFQEFVGIPDAQGLYYTLAMEMVFYIFFSCLYLAKLNRMSLPIAWAGLALLAIPGISVPLLLHKRVPLAGLFYFLCLFVGTSVYRHFNGEVMGRALRTLFWCFLLTTIAEIYCNYVLVKKDDLTEHYTFAAVFLSWAGACSLFLLAYKLRHHDAPKVLVWLGTVSYSVYLLHSPLRSLVPLWPNRLFSFLAALALTLIVSAVAYRLIEEPFMALGKKIALRSSTPRTASLEVGTKELVSGVA